MPKVVGGAMKLQNEVYPEKQEMHDRLSTGESSEAFSVFGTESRIAAGRITKAELAQARKNWGDGLVAISKAYDAEGIDAARTVANEILDTAYGYNMGDVLFKPTLASGEKTFRPTKEGALAYFVGHDENYPLDSGFGLKGWREVTSETSATFIAGDVAMWMGWVICTDKDGGVTKVDKSWGYQKDAEGTLRIVQHHSSLPYQP
ncbi:MAG: phosphoribosyl-AMP cyclohydrolase [Pseudomonadota bacterium]